MLVTNATYRPRIKQTGSFWEKPDIPPDGMQYIATASEVGTGAPCCGPELDSAYG